MTLESFIAARRQARISQEVLAKELNMHPRSLQAFEAGQRGLAWSTPLSEWFAAIERVKARRAAELESKAS